MFTRTAAFYDAVYGFKDYAAEAEQIQALIRAHGRSDSTTLLDVACGTGGHLAFLKKHYASEGLDIDPNLLAIARERHPELVFHLGSWSSSTWGAASTRWCACSARSATW